LTPVERTIIMEDLKINSELFVLDSDENYILYLPLKSTALLVNKDVISLLNAINEGISVNLDTEIVNQLKDIGVFDKPTFNFKKTEYKPTQVTFLPSFSCNLECIYCYSYGGEFLTSKISYTAAKKAIDFIFQNALELNVSHIHVSFHGGGEPLMYSNKNFINGIVNYSKSKSNVLGINAIFTAVTNGIDIAKFDFDWIKNVFSRFTLSLDGPPEIQNYQRPRRGRNKDSYSSALQTIELFEKYGMTYSIRSTITKHSVNHMSDILTHFAEISRIKDFHFEPLFECGRCKTIKIEAPSPTEFVDNFKLALATARNLNVNISYSGITSNRISDKFCGAAGDNFFITPDEYVTTCLEACRINEDDNIPFIIGKFDHLSNKFEFDYQKINLLKSRVVTNMDSCTDCFCKFSCSGDCIIKVLKNTGDMFDSTNNERCKINKILSEFIIKQNISEI
jgi:uncharacterized protein